MSADSMRGLSTNPGEVEQVVWHRGTSGDKRSAGSVSQKVLSRIWLNSNELAKMRRFKDGDQPLLVRVLSPLDEIVVRDCWI
jgi:hypothetical protein